MAAWYPALRKIPHPAVCHGIPYRTEDRMARLQQRLDAIRKGFEKEAPPHVLDLMHGATRDLADALARDPGLGVGDAAPSFRLPDQDGNVVDSADLLARGPLVVALFRGHW